MKDKYKDIIARAGTNGGKELEVYCDRDFTIDSQLQFFDEVQKKYRPLEIKGTYFLMERDSRIMTDKGGYIIKKID